MDALFALACAFVGVQLAVLLLNWATFPRLRPPHPAEAGPGAGPEAGPEAGNAVAPSASILLPVRNELENLPATLPRLLEQPALEVLVLDDGSDDGTGAWLATVEHPRLRVLAGQPLPSGWVGKNWACHQLARAARGELLVFTDADVRWTRATLPALTAHLRRERAGFASVWPRQETPTLAERLVVPLIDGILLGALPWPLVNRLPAPALAAGNGQLLAFTRSAYERCGGHERVRGEVLEDVRLAQAAKAGGARLALALGGELVSTRMYRSWPQLRDGFAKNILAAVGGRAPLLLALLALSTLSFTLAWPLALWEPRWLAPALGGLLLRALSAAASGRSAWEAPLQALAPPAVWPIAWRALRRRGGFEWKGRAYR